MELIGPPPSANNDSAIPVVIIEDHDLIRLSVKLSLEKSGQIEVIGEAKTGTQGIELARCSEAKIVIMDLGLPEINGIDATRQIKESTSKKVVILTSHADEESVISALSAGADGYLMKDTKTEDFLLALYMVANGACWLEDSIARKAISHISPRMSFRNQSFTDLEYSIVTLVKSGLTLSEVACELCIPVSRVHELVTNLLRRTARTAIDYDKIVIHNDDELEHVLVCSNCRQPTEGSSSCPKDGGRAIQDGHIGETIAERYRIVSLVGCGGNAAVYKARNRFTGKFVAIKILHYDLAQNSDFINRFRQEALAISSLDHPNVISVIDFGVNSEDTAYMVMEYLSGTSLLDLIKDGILDYRKAIPIFLGICDGVAHAHEAGIVHRDLKPANIHILDRENRGALVKVLDFGLAKVAGDLNIVMTAPGEVFGSPAFMSPEQCRGQKIDMRSDIYSMGCLMHQTLTGEILFECQSAPEMMYHHIHTPAAKVSDVITMNNVPPLVESVILKCLEKDPDDRFQSIHELKRALSCCSQ